MKFGNIARSTMLATGLVALNISAFTGAASAGDYRHGNGYGYNRSAPYHAAPRFAPSHGNYNHGHHGRRHNNGAAVALGVGALILGTIIASEANRQHRDRYDD